MQKPISDSCTELGCQARGKIATELVLLFEQFGECDGSFPGPLSMPPPLEPVQRLKYQAVKGPLWRSPDLPQAAYLTDPSPV
jgi:hypothetical protein